jgi:branched-subunit amino acid aminotransferase/4-amino-4-deoxychorismate lyase
MQNHRFAYFNGAIMPAEQAAVSPYDVGLLRGYAVFDLLQTIGGVPFQFTEHITRLRASAKMLGLEVPATDDEIAEITVELLRLNECTEATVRYVLTGGESPDGMHFDPSTPTFLIITHNMFEVPEQFYVTGAKLITHEYRRELPEAKTTNYLTWLRNHHKLDAAGAIDVLYHADGLVSEAATASFYVVRDGRICAPGEGVLRGTIGELVMGLTASEYELVLGPVTLEEAFGAEEAFITSSVRGVVPITRIDDSTIGDGTVGPVTTRLMEICRAAMKKAD